MQLLTPDSCMPRWRPCWCPIFMTNCDFLAKRSFKPTNITCVIHGTERVGTLPLYGLTEMQAWLIVLLRPDGNSNIRTEIMLNPHWLTGLPVIIQHQFQHLVNSRCGFWSTFWALSLLLNSKRVTTPSVKKQLCIKDGLLFSQWGLLRNTSASQAWSHSPNQKQLF